MALMITLPPQVWIVKRELLWVPGFGQCLWALKAIAIDRKAGKSARDQVVEQGTDRLARGLNVIVFPEGTRIAPGERKRYGLGGPMLAVATGTPVLPVAHNAGDCWRRNAFVKVPGEIVLAFGPPIDPAGMTAQALADTTERWIEGRLAAIRGRPIAAGADTGTTAAA
jgi:1-acyl-sn-glycerol-3-phosphate acyltransferase